MSATTGPTRSTSVPGTRGVTLPGNNIAVPLGSYGYNANGVQFGFSPFGLGGYLTDPSNTNSVKAIINANVQVPADMLELGDANLMWVLPAILQAFYGIAGPVSFSGYGRLDISSRDTTENPSFGGSPGILQASRLRHRGHFNVVLSDGHLERPADDVLFGKSDAALARWNNDHLPHPDRLTK